MSHRTLQRLIVRLLHDPELVERMHADPEAVLGPLDLDEEERRQVLAVDRRAFGLDPLRRLRALRTLADEFKGSTTAALSETRSLASLLGYFSAEEFHRVVEERGSMALGFADYLLRLSREGRVRAPWFPELVRLEATMARCPRALADSEEDAAASPGPRRPPRPHRLHWRLAPGVAAGAFRGDVVPALNACEQYLFEVGLMPGVALCDDAPRLPAVPESPEPRTRLLFVPLSRGIHLVELDEPSFVLAGLLTAPIRPATLLSRAAEVGVPETRAREIAEEWLEAEVIEAVEA